MCKQLNRKQRYEISAHLALKNIKVSLETIYRWIRQDKAQWGDLYKHCHHRLKHRKRPVERASHIPHRVIIHEMPHEAKSKRLGDFEMNLIVGVQGQGGDFGCNGKNDQYDLGKKACEQE